MFAKSGLRTAPCGVPSSVLIRCPSSSTPAASHFATNRITPRPRIRCSTNGPANSGQPCRTAPRACPTPLNTSPAPSPVNASRLPSRTTRASLGAGTVRYTFTVTDFHRLPFAGLPAHPSTASEADQPLAPRRDLPRHRISAQFHWKLHHPALASLSRPAHMKVSASDGLVLALDQDEPADSVSAGSLRLMPINIPAGHV